MIIMEIDKNICVTYIIVSLKNWYALKNKNLKSYQEFSSKNGMSRTFYVMVATLTYTTDKLLRCK